MIHTTQTYQIGDNVELMKMMQSDSIDTIITSPPYWGLRDYGVDEQIGLEPTLAEYHTRLLKVTAECMRVLKPTGVMFWNHGDSYAGSGGPGGDYKEGGLREGQPKAPKREWLDPKLPSRKRGRETVNMNMFAAKCMVMQNERLIIKMVDDHGWILRNRIIWEKPNGMPSSVTDRFSNKYEPVYMLTKNKSYWFDLDAVRVPHNHPERSTGKTVQKLSGHGTTLDRGAGSKKDGISDYVREKGVNYNPLGKNPGDVWTIPTQPYPESHFATFPTALIEPMIKAACPAEICPVCGMARDRIAEPTGNHVDGIGKYSKTADHVGSSPTSLLRTKQVIEKHTTDWTSCDCNAGWIAGTVLDPFAGSGTVGEVARNMNRNAILLELNPVYGKLIAKRTMADTPPLTAYFGDD